MKVEGTQDLAVKAPARVSPKYPTTFHYRGDGAIVMAGRSLNLRRRFRPEMR